MQVHFRGFPSSSLLPWSGPSSLRSAYLNSLKVDLSSPSPTTGSSNNARQLQGLAHHTAVRAPGHDGKPRKQQT